MMATSELLILISGSASAGLTILQHVSARAWLRRAPAAGGEPIGPVTVLKPLCGIDDGLEDNIRSFVEQHGVETQVVLGAANPHDPALIVAERLRAEYPERDLTIVRGAAPLGVNPKVRILAQMSREARHDLWLISDSNVRAAPDYVARMVAEFESRDVGLVSGVFVGVGARSLGATLENLHLNSWIPGGMCAMQVLTGQACGMGKSMLFRGSRFRELGGWDAVRDLLAEDFAIGRAFVRAGDGARTSHCWVTTVTADWSLASFASRHLRWNVLRRRLLPISYLLEPILNPSLWGLTLLLLGRPREAVLLLTLKIVSDALLARHLLGARAGWFRYLLVPAKDLVMAGFWALGLFRRRVVWRGKALLVGRGTRISSAPDPRPAPRWTRPTRGPQPSLRRPRRGRPYATADTRSRGRRSG